MDERSKIFKNTYPRKDAFKLWYSILNLHGDVIESLRDAGGRVVGEVFSETWRINLRAEKEALRKSQRGSLQAERPVRGCGLVEKGLAPCEEEEPRE